MEDNIRAAVRHMIANGDWNNFVEMLPSEALESLASSVHHRRQLDGTKWAEQKWAEGLRLPSMTVPLSSPELIGQREKIEMIKKIREEHKVGLMTAKIFVDLCIAQQTFPEPDGAHVHRAAMLSA